MNEEKRIDTESKPKPEKRNPIASVAVGGVGLFCLVHILNFTLGGIIPLEIPDALPGVGNLDEAAAAALLVSCLAYFGLDVGAIFGRLNKIRPEAEKSAKGEVVD